MNSLFGTGIGGLITFAICAYIWIEGGKAQKRLADKKRTTH